MVLPSFMSDLLLLLLDLDDFEVGAAQAQFVAAEGDFDGVAQRGDFADVDLGAPDDPHIHDPAAERTLPGDFDDGYRFSDFDISKCSHDDLPAADLLPSSGGGRILIS